MRMRVRGTVAAVAAALVLAGCGGDNLAFCDGCGTPTPTVTLTPTPTVTEVDVTVTPTPRIEATP